jgi:4-hydroxythreonine-4-phosphate dehydrogenase
MTARSPAPAPVVGLTMGDPAGIGPEVIAKALASGAPVLERCTPVVIGDAGRLRLAAGICGVATDIPCIDLANVDPALPFGQLSPGAGQAAYEYVVRAVELALAGELDAICTLPLNKGALHAAGHDFPGHTELLAHLTGTDEVSMMLDTGSFRVVHVTTHVGLIDAIEAIEPELVLRTIRRADAALRRAGVERPAVGVCGINPHAGEGGLFGRGEEEEKIAPAVAAARAEGVAVEGPLPADTAFYRARRGDFDVVVAMYHDQGHAPVKVLGIENGVNVTIGLPIVRTSVDHGTAFDIAGTGKADERSLIAALEAAVALGPRR